MLRPSYPLLVCHSYRDLFIGSILLFSSTTGVRQIFLIHDVGNDDVWDDRLLRYTLPGLVYHT